MLFCAKSVINSVKLTVSCVQDFRFRKISAGRVRVYGKSSQLRGNCTGLRCGTLAVWPPEKDILSAQAEIKHNLPGLILVGVQGVTGERVMPL